MLKEGLRGAAVPNGPGTPAWGDGESCPGGGRCLRRACGGQRLPRPGHMILGGHGVLPGRWSVLKVGPPGAAVPNGPGTPAWGDGESCPGGGRCLGRACGGSSPQRPGRTSLGGGGAEGPA